MCVCVCVRERERSGVLANASLFGVSIAEKIFHTSEKSYEHKRWTYRQTDKYVVALTGSSIDGQTEVKRSLNRH